MPLTNAVFITRSRIQLNLFKTDWLTLPNYQPPKNGFPGAILRLKETYLLFTSGKVVINRCKACPDVSECEKLLNIALEQPVLSHLSGAMKVGPVDLRLLNELVEHGEYEPELHAGLLYRIENVSVIIYQTGTVMCCGLKSFEHLEAVETEVCKLIDTYHIFKGQ
jgi:TATA-box binding protein (TBP) (component of TFIID and TFIIIB)